MMTPISEAQYKVWEKDLGLLKEQARRDPVLNRKCRGIIEAMEILMKKILIYENPRAY